MDYPHVTEILQGAGLVDTRFYTEEGSQRGSAVHLATQYLDEGDLDVGSLDLKIARKVDSYQRFLDEVKPEVLAVEQRVVNETYRYCGTLDRVMRIQGKTGVLDIKGSAAQADWHGVQIAAYQHAIETPPTHRWNLYLTDTGYKLVERADEDDWPIFLAALTLHNWRKNHE